MESSREFVSSFIECIEIDNNNLSVSDKLKFVIKHISPTVYEYILNFSYENASTVLKNDFHIIYLQQKQLKMKILINMYSN